MKYGPVYVKCKNGSEIELRSAEPADAPALTEFLRITSGETPYLIREPDEIHVTQEQERAFLQSKMDDEKELLLIALIDGRHIGNCALMQIAGYRRYAHRCQIVIALYQAYCGMGIGTIMLETILQIAGESGYEQAELEVMADNHKAIALYEKMGFRKYGLLPNNAKYSDGSYDDAFWMMKRLNESES